MAATSTAHVANTECPAAARVAFPAEEKAQQLPGSIQTQTARHDRVALEVAVEKPEIRGDIQFGNDLAFAIAAAFVADVSNAIDHQHVRQGQPCVAGAKQLPVGAGEQFLASVRRLLFWCCAQNLTP